MKRDRIDWRAYWKNKRKKKNKKNTLSYVVDRSELDLPFVTMYTDGSHSGLYNCTGWACVIMQGTHSSVLYDGYAPGYTNNMMELLAMVRGLEVLNTKCNVRIISDSMYVVQAIKEDWITNWERNGWVTKTGKPVANRDYWEMLSKLLEEHNVTVCWQRAHKDELNTDDQRGNDVADCFAKIGRYDAEFGITGVIRRDDNI